VKAPDLVGLGKVREFVLAKLYRPMPTVPQGGLPSVLSALSYISVRFETEYKHSNLNRRLIDHHNSMARFKNVSLAAACVKKFVGVAAVNLFSQAVYVDFDRV
jgi:hypothetical protein